MTSFGFLFPQISHMGEEGPVIQNQRVESSNLLARHFPVF